MNNNRSQRDAPRKGAMLVFIAAILVMVLAMVAFSVDVAFMQLSRTELRAAVDAAAKAAASELSSSNGNTALAIQAGQDVANANEVAGAGFQLSTTDFEFGRSVAQEDGTWEFVAGATPYTSVRVTGLKSPTSASGPVNLFFAPVLGSSTFTPQHVSVASQFKQDLVLAIDRSHSMCFDDSGVDWRYPDGVPTHPHPIAYPPHSTHSRWADLKGAISHFLNIVDQTAVPPRVGLITWGSLIGNDTAEFRITGKTEKDVAVDSELTFDRDSIMEPIISRGNKVMLGGTNLSKGLDTAMDLLADQSDPLAKRTIVLMTDGQWNKGRPPRLSASDAKDAGIVIHTITFLNNADQTDMIEVATITGGRHFHASNGSELEAIFIELARSLPVALTK